MSFPDGIPVIIFRYGRPPIPQSYLPPANPKAPLSALRSYPTQLNLTQTKPPHSKPPHFKPPQTKPPQTKSLNQTNPYDHRKPNQKVNLMHKRVGSWTAAAAWAEPETEPMLMRKHKKWDKCTFLKILRFFMTLILISFARSLAWYIVIFLCSNTNPSLKSTFLTHFCHNGRFRTLFIPLSLPAMSPHQTAATFHLLYVCHIFQCHREIGKCHHPGLTHSDLLIHCRYWHSCRVTFWLVEGGGSVGWLAGIRNLLGTGRGPN